MFDEIEGIQPRFEQRLRPYDTTDGQAEVLVFDVIEPSLIRAAVFDNAAVRDAHRGLLGDRTIILNSANDGYFTKRSYVR